MRFTLPSLLFCTASLFACAADDGGSDSGADTSGSESGTTTSMTSTTMDPTTTTATTSTTSSMTTTTEPGTETGLPETSSDDGRDTLLSDTGSSGGDSSTGEPVDPCAPAADDTDCDSCMKDTCCDQLTACADDPECVCFQDCAAGMDPGLMVPMVCGNMCGIATPFLHPTVGQVLACANNCLEQCL
jgi:hypothetical protein